eukprot:3080600-Pyramimonas_sp.AAC.3
MARQVKRAKHLEAKAEETSKEKEAASSKCLEVAAHFPHVARARGIQAQKCDKQDPGFIRQHCEKLALLSFNVGVASGFSIKPARLRAFSASLVEDMRNFGILRLLWKAARFRRGGRDHYVVITISHEWDTTKQQMALATAQKLGRPSSRRVGHEVLFQGCRLIVTLAMGGEVYTFKEDLVCKALVLDGKAASYTAAGLQMVKPFDFSSGTVLQAVAVATDVVIEDLRADKGSTNMPCIKHFAAVLSENCPTGLPDATFCEMHNSHRIKNTSPDIEPVVGKLFCMSNLMKLAGTVNDMSTRIVQIVERADRVEMPAPPGNREKWFQMFDALFDLTGDHHRRKHSSRSSTGASWFVDDVDSLLELLNDDPRNDSWVHYCFDPASKRPCCRSVHDFRSKLATRLANVFVVPAFPTVTMSRFTYALIALSR